MFLFLAGTVCTTRLVVCTVKDRSTAEGEAMFFKRLCQKDWKITNKGGSSV